MDVFTNAIFTDSVGATETGFQGMGMQDKEQISTDGPVVGLGPDSVVLDDDNRLLDPATDIGKIGRLGRGGNVPVGYYKDPEKSAKTFLEIDGSGTRCPATSPGSRRATGSRCSAAAPTASTPAGRRSTPRRWRWRSRRTRPSTTASWSASPTRSTARPSPPSSSCARGTTLELEELRDFLREHLSGYKLPRSLTVVPQIPRNATGKAQYPAAKEMALAHVAV